MLRSSRLDVAALSAAFLFAFVPPTHADESPAPPKVTAQDVTPPRSAVERWNRVKSQFATQPTNRADLPSEIVAPSRQPAASMIAQPSELSAEKSPDWGLPVPIISSELKSDVSGPPEPGTASGSRPLDRSIQPSRINDRVASVDDHLRQGTPRPAGPYPIPSGPTRNPTQVRRISEIAPINDLDHDRDIRDYAAERARELNVKFGGDQYEPRNFPNVAMQWTPPHAEYYPLYFQDGPFERYGHTHPFPFQPVVSATRFTAQLIFLPYQMTITPPWELQTGLGWYRPGDVVPKMHYQIPWNTTAAIVEAGTLTGLFYLIP